MNVGNPLFYNGVNACTVHITTEQNDGEGVARGPAAVCPKAMCRVSGAELNAALQRTYFHGSMHVSFCPLRDWDRD